MVDRFRTPAAPPGLPPLVGGWIGYLSAEWACVLEPRVRRPEHDPLGAPDAAFDLFRDVIAFDHAHQRLFLVAACEAGEGDFAGAQERLERLQNPVRERAPRRVAPRPQIAVSA